ncbi:BPTD_3080 family restriction endonuclease [Fibrella aquatilis]|uniref:DEAD/DEAH box helicase family protein n=1 Tax=Fibrella aquatilis TaxID=2817059 RepID=A0A939GB39_9BACT|nr:DEAD/DEAH box helicase family protein [Fibrella aquatilis]MBO0933123.1 DEAD/DEAH box helicase family protein [Fibrella aquatilis]
MDASPILNNPYLEPLYHYATTPDGEQKGSLDYSRTVEGRRIFTNDMIGAPTRVKGQKSLFDVNEFAPQYGEQLVNLLRKEVAKWRTEGYPHTTRVTLDLLKFWFIPDGLTPIPKRKLFFVQQEAIETAIWLNEVASRSNAGTNILNRLGEEQDNEADSLPRIAFKMATGTGKTVVMGALILYHYFNRQEYRNDTRFADYFLCVAPGITIRDRLSVLRVDTNVQSGRQASDYYRQRGLVPQQFEHLLGGLNARLVITNYHSFEPKTLQGNKRTPFDGKISRRVVDGEVVEVKNDSKGENKEEFGQVIKRLFGSIKPGSRLVILNDEAHHCYLPKKADKRSADDEATDEENQRAAVWFSGIRELTKRFQVRHIYDLSATPYYLRGSGYDAYKLFPWIVSDFGLIDAIESGLVKIPFLPESDSTQRLSEPVLRNLYEHVKEGLPKKGQTASKKAAKAQGTSLTEEPPRMPETLVTALEQFYAHYERTHSQMGTLYSTPPVFIAVCNNTSVSKELYKHIAGYEATDAEGKTKTTPGRYDLFNNFDQNHLPKNKPPTLLIDSAALDDSGQIDDDFKKVFAPEIEKFKDQYARIYGQGSADRLTDADVLREVVNTVGKPNSLGSHVRCVVSVSMLTEGWDANTVTHIMGLRAFGSQLLCEQVAGRALRRQSYELLPYDKVTSEPVSIKVAEKKPESIVWKFPPEYAQIIGVPFKSFKKGKSAPPPVPPTYTHITALPDRQAVYEITFPNIIGYRIETMIGDIKADFSHVEPFEIDYSSMPVRTLMQTAIEERVEELELTSVLDLRDQQVIYKLTQQLIHYYHSGNNGQPQFQKFNQLRAIVTEWYNTRVALVGETNENYKRLLYFWNHKEVADHIQLGIMAATAGSDVILPMFNHYNRFGSTRYVNGNTSRPIYETRKSHVNYVVADTDSWEQIAAKTLDELPEVLSYVKNAFLGFAIPYVNEGKEKLYFPDFIARIQTSSGRVINLIVEITGMNLDKAAKKQYVIDRWLPAANSVREQYGYDEWFFVEIANDIRYIKNQLADKLGEINEVVKRADKSAKIRATFGRIKDGPTLTSEQLRREYIYE